MLRTAPVALFLSACLSVASFAQTRATTAAPTTAPDDKYKNEALVWERFDTVIHMHADGTGDRTIHVVVRLQSEGAAAAVQRALRAVCVGI